MVAEQTISRQWIMSRQKGLQSIASDYLDAVSRVREVAKALSKVGLPEPDSTYFSASYCGLSYLAINDEPRWRELCAKARAMSSDTKVETKFEADHTGQEQVARTQVHVPYGGNGLDTLLTVIVHIGLRTGCKVEYVEQVKMVPTVVCE